MNSLQQYNQSEIFADYNSNPEERYEKVYKIGQGAYGVVYQAIDKITDNIVAVKILKINGDLNSHLNEESTLSDLNNKNIVKLYDKYIDNEKKEIWLIIEYCNMGSLSDVINITGQTFFEAEIACILENVLQGLDYLHKNHRMHRDLKSANILLNNEGEAKISDFGVSSSKAQTDTFVGSPYWQSPEQLNKERYTNKVDIWALGICILEMAEGMPPYGYLLPNNAMKMIKANPIIHFQDPSQFSEELNNFLSNCLSIDPEKRYTAEQLLNHNFFKIHRENLQYERKSLYERRKNALQQYKIANLRNESSSSSNNSGSNSSINYSYFKNQLLYMSQEQQNFNKNKSSSDSSTLEQHFQSFIEKNSEVKTFIEKDSYSQSHGSQNSFQQTQQQPSQKQKYEPSYFSYFGIKNYISTNNPVQQSNVNVQFSNKSISEDYSLKSNTNDNYGNEKISNIQNSNINSQNDYDSEQNVSRNNPQDAKHQISQNYKQKYEYEEFNAFKNSNEDFFSFMTQDKKINKNNQEQIFLKQQNDFQNSSIPIKFIQNSSGYLSNQHSNIEQIKCNSPTNKVQTQVQNNYEGLDKFFVKPKQKQNINGSSYLQDRQHSNSYHIISQKYEQESCENFFLQNQNSADTQYNKLNKISKYPHSSKSNGFEIKEQQEQIEQQKQNYDLKDKQTFSNLQASNNQNNVQRKIEGDDSTYFYKTTRNKSNNFSLYRINQDSLNYSQCQIEDTEKKDKYLLNKLENKQTIKKNSQHQEKFNDIQNELHDNQTPQKDSKLFENYFLTTEKTHKYRERSDVYQKDILNFDSQETNKFDNYQSNQKYQQIIPISTFSLQNTQSGVYKSSSPVNNQPKQNIENKYLFQNNIQNKYQNQESESIQSTNKLSHNNTQDNISNQQTNNKNNISQLQSNQQINYNNINKQTYQHSEQIPHIKLFDDKQNQHINEQIFSQTHRVFSSKQDLSDTNDKRKNRRHKIFSDMTRPKTNSQYINISPLLTPQNNSYLRDNLSHTERNNTSINNTCIPDSSFTTNFLNFITNQQQQPNQMSRQQLQSQQKNQFYQNQFQLNSQNQSQILKQTFPFTQNNTNQAHHLQSDQQNQYNFGIKDYPQQPFILNTSNNNIRQKDIHNDSNYSMQSFYLKQSQLNKTVHQQNIIPQECYTNIKNSVSQNASLNSSRIRIFETGQKKDNRTRINPYSANESPCQSDQQYIPKQQQSFTQKYNQLQSKQNIISTQSII